MRSPTRQRVLLIDDEPMVLGVLQKLLELRFDVTVAESCAQAIEVFSEGPDPDVVICDMMMLDGTGIDVHEWLVEHRPGLVGRVIFATGGTFTPKAAEFLQDVAVHQLTKPFRIADLEAMIDHVLAQG